MSFFPDRFACARLQNRYNSPLSDPDDCNGCFYIYTDLGLASTPDNGTTWVYRGVMQGLGAPSAWGNLSDGMRQNGTAHGGATWWRPAVVYNPDDRLYHGFFAYLLQSRGESGATTQQQYHVTHYTSHNLTSWSFVGFLPAGASRYDTVVFRIKDGRWLLVSAGDHPPTLQSHDLVTWEECNDTALQFATDEGPHVTRWKNTMWMNWEPRCDDTNSTRNSCEKNLLKSTDGGLHWKDQPESLFDGSPLSRRYLDSGQAHQGPLLPQGDTALVLYFAENRFTLAPDMALINTQRSVLQVAPVVLLSNGSLRADRSLAVAGPLVPPDPVEMIDRGPIAPATRDPVWHVRPEDAMIISLAELNRWTPRWCEDEDVSYELLAGYSLHASLGSCQSYLPSAEVCVEACIHNASCAAVVVSVGAACPKPTEKPGTLRLNMQALSGDFAVINTSTADACKSHCVSNAKCGSFVFRHAGSSAGGGSCGAVLDTCCYLLADPNPKMINHPGWDSWAKGGDEPSCEGAPPVKPTADSICCKFLPQSALDTHSDLSVMQPNVSSWAKLGILTSTVQPWRDQTRVRRYFEGPTHEGADPNWVWQLRTASSLRHRETKARLDYVFTVAANGTILGVQRYAADGTSTELRPLRQFRRDGWEPGNKGANRKGIVDADAAIHRVKTDDSVQKFKPHLPTLSDDASSPAWTATWDAPVWGLPSGVLPSGPLQGNGDFGMTLQTNNHTGCIEFWLGLNSCVFYRSVVACDP
jgi:hypothetical protein